MKPKIDYSLYLVTDRALMSTNTLEEAVELAIVGGATAVQLREKAISSLEFYRMAIKIKQITDKHYIPLIINDRIDIALAVNAAGIHVGQNDLPVHSVRAMIGKNKILGVSAATLDEAIRAQEDGADYLGVGAMFTTRTKTDAKFVPVEELKRIRETVNLPIVAIGGINRTTIPLFNGIGIDGVSVVSALISAKDITGEAKELKQLALRMREG